MRTKQAKFISYLHARDLETVLLFKKEYPKLYNFIAAHVTGKGDILKAYNKFLRIKDSLSHEEKINLGYEGKAISSLSFGTKTFYELPRVQNFFYASVYQYIWNQKI
jgi:hypothetical protein